MVGGLNKARLRGTRVPVEEPSTASIPLSRGRQILTLRDASNYITKLPKAEHEAPEWQAAMEALILVADLGGPRMFVRIGVMRALHHSKPAPKIAPPSKRAKAYSIVRSKSWCKGGRGELQPRGTQHFPQSGWNAWPRSPLSDRLCPWPTFPCSRTSRGAISPS